jgi:hypothetical protein
MPIRMTWPVWAQATCTDAAWKAETTPSVISTPTADMKAVATMPAVNSETVAKVAMATPADLKWPATPSISRENSPACARASTSPRVKSEMSKVSRVLRSGMFVVPGKRTPP